jgi:acyl carrier protein
VTLISVIEEEFEIEVPLDELELASFDSMLRFVRLHTSA